MSYSNYSNRYILKFADNTVIVSFPEGEEQGHGPVVDDFVASSDKPFIILNKSKTKDMIIDFRKSPPSPLPTVFKAADIETAESYQYLAVVKVQ